MRDVVSVERVGERLVVVPQAGDTGFQGPCGWRSTDEGLHYRLASQGYLRTEPYGDDAVAGRWVRKSAAVA